jgi:hypothetical protein
MRGGPQEGAMGVHYVNGDYVNDDVLDPQKPEALMYELKDGKLRLLGVEYIIFAEKWHAKEPEGGADAGRPGHALHREPQPLRHPGLLRPPRVGVAHQPRRRVRDWNSKVSCDDFTGIGAKS